jgi:hypothetical protein
MRGIPIVAIMHFEVKSLSRARGHNAVQRSAYITRDRLRDESQHRTHNYRTRGGLEHTEILVPRTPQGADAAWARDRATLWNAAEQAERRVNARVGREYVIALPHELSIARRLDLARGFAITLAERYGTAVELAVHRATSLGDPRNHHAHILSTTRTLMPEGLGVKSAIEKSDTDRRASGLPGVREEIRLLRLAWAEQVNEALAAADLVVRVDPRSLWEQGSARVPAPRLTPAMIAIERAGGVSDAANRLREQHAARQELMTAYANHATVSSRSDDVRQAARERWRAYREAADRGEAMGDRQPARERGMDAGL